MPYLITISQREDVKKVMDIVPCYVFKIEDITEKLKQSEYIERDFNQLRKEIFIYVHDNHLNNTMIVDRYKDRYSREMILAMIKDVRGK